MTLVRIYCVHCGELNYDDEETSDYPCPNCDNEPKEDASQSEHEVFSLNHKDFTCNECSETFMIRDDSKLNICFPCKLILCDQCVENHK